MDLFSYSAGWLAWCVPSSSDKGSFQGAQESHSSLGMCRCNRVIDLVAPWHSTIPSYSSSSSTYTSSTSSTSSLLALILPLFSLLSYLTSIFFTWLVLESSFLHHHPPLSTFLLSIFISTFIILIIFSEHLFNFLLYKSIFLLLHFLSYATLYCTFLILSDFLPLYFSTSCSSSYFSTNTLLRSIPRMTVCPPPPSTLLHPSFLPLQLFSPAGLPPPYTCCSSHFPHPPFLRALLLRRQIFTSRVFKSVYLTDCTGRHAA